MGTRNSLAPSEVIDRELAMRGTSLAEWSEQRGVADHAVAAMLDGRSAPANDVLDELAESVGVTREALRRTGIHPIVRL